MPIIFIHGVNTRDGDDYRRDLAARDELLQRLLLNPLAEKEARFSQVEIENPYWGKYGVSFRWDQASLPDVRTLQDLGADTLETPVSDLELAATVNELAGTSQRNLSPLDTLGADNSMLQRAAEKDLTRFVEAVLSPIILSEMRLFDNSGVKPEAEGVLEALLAISGKEVASDLNVRAAVAAASSDEEVMNLLKEKIQARFEQLAAPKEAVPPDSQLEALGPDWLEDLKDRVGELFDRAREAPGRAATLPALQLFREDLHSNISQFLGDVFVYLNERDSSDGPGPIISTVLEALTKASQYHNNEPLIVITHSMGGNILYDTLTHYAPDLLVDAWVSVASQVGQFEEMKLFKASDKDICRPDKVRGPKGVRYWLNIYDPADVLAFKAAPIFEDVDEDIEFLTGESAFKSHNAYFKRASFYHLMRDYLERGLL